MTYYVNDEKVEMYEFQEALLETIRLTCKESFDEYLDEVYEPLEVVGIKYDVSYILQQIDPIAYDMVMSEYFDNIYLDEMYELDNGCELTRYNKTFRKDV